MSPETINEINNEAYQYSVWEREQKNIILKLRDPSKRQAAWNRLFLIDPPDNSYLFGGIY